jgi:hypothetical protein
MKIAKPVAANGHSQKQPRSIAKKKRLVFEIIILPVTFHYPYPQKMQSLIITLQGSFQRVSVEDAVQEKQRDLARVGRDAKDYQLGDRDDDQAMNFGPNTFPASPGLPVLRDAARPAPAPTVASTSDAEQKKFDKTCKSLLTRHLALFVVRAY